MITGEEGKGEGRTIIDEEVDLKKKNHSSGKMYPDYCCSGGL